MKKIFLSLAMVSATLAFAQKKEIQAAFKAAESGDVSSVNSQISAAENSLGGKTYLLEPEVLEQYYFAKGFSLLKSGKALEGASYLAKINDLGKSKIYTGKDASKNKVYFVGKNAADASGISGLKEENYTPTTAAKLNALVNPLVQGASKAAIDAYNSKNYALAGDKFKETYYLYKAAGTDDKTQLMNSALSYSNAEKLNETAEIYTDLINSGYTGVETSYTAKNKKTGAVEAFDKSTWETLKKTTASDYSDFNIEKSKSVEKELYQMNARTLYNLKRYDESINITHKGLAKFPNDPTLMNIKGMSYYASGKASEFIDVLKAQVASNPKDFESWYNLGVMQNSAKQTADAENSFKKTIEIKPDYISAYQNLTFLVMGDDENAIKEIEANKKSGKTDLYNKMREERRTRFANAIPYAEKWHNLDPNNIEVVTLLKGLYITTQNEAKVAEYKAKENALKAQGK